MKSSIQRLELYEIDKIMSRDTRTQAAGSVSLFVCADTKVAVIS